MQPVFGLVIALAASAAAAGQAVFDPCSVHPSVQKVRVRPESAQIGVYQASDFIRREPGSWDAACHPFRSRQSSSGPTTVGRCGD